MSKIGKNLKNKINKYYNNHNLNKLLKSAKISINLLFPAIDKHKLLLRT